MEPSEHTRAFVEQARAAGIHSIEDLIHRAETLERSDTWIYIACDRDADGSLRLVNATGFYPDELSAGLAGDTYIRQWTNHMDEDEDPPPEIFPVPLFIESEKP